MAKKIKILHIIPGFGGGISSFVKNLAIGNDKDEFQHDVIGFGGYPNDFIEAIASQNGNVYALKSVYKNVIDTIMTYKQVVKQGDYDFIHCHISGIKGYFFKFLTKNARHVVIMHAHRTADEKNSFLTKILLPVSRLFTRSRARIYMGCSKMANAYIYGEKFIKSHQVYVIPNGVNTALFKDISQDTYLMFDKEFNVKSDDFVIGHIGRFNLQKNHLFMLEIARGLKEVNFKFKMILVGNGELRQDIDRYIKDYDLVDNVICVGYRKDIPQLIQYFDLFILPSHFEGLPTVAVEAQAAGTSCLLSDKITDEVDLGLGLVNFLSIDDYILWVNRIINFIPQEIPYAVRVQKLEQRGFTLKGMKYMYKKVLEANSR
ncbi:glycosyltransferase [Bifidobacterium sp. SO1]|uniref:glycosyltransferase n=1 Tax=Bifidobacterium sp. SO1 TaxID=2809029 RepID=UPI001BDC67A9|nr:glycosyltransferase [Bifidobacterium sp. SO1]MBT1160450.1 glycosyltransferase [Bifidobacterium sp. SO1]